MAAIPRDVYRNFLRELKQIIDIIIGSQVTECGDCADFDISDNCFITESKV